MVSVTEQFIERNIFNQVFHQCSEPNCYFSQVPWLPTSIKQSFMGSKSIDVAIHPDSIQPFSSHSVCYCIHCKSIL